MSVTWIRSLMMAHKLNTLIKKHWLVIVNTRKLPKQEDYLCPAPFGNQCENHKLAYKYITDTM